MPRVCTICSHPNRAKIEAALVNGEPNRRIASRFQIQEIAIRRHVADHFPATLARAREALEITRGDALLDQVKTVLAKTWVVLAHVEAEHDHEKTLKALAGLDARLTLLAKMMGELRDQSVTNILVIPEWQQLRTRVLAALVPYPDARAAVVAALEAVPIPSGPTGAVLDGRHATSPTAPISRPPSRTSLDHAHR
jgi:hypothetical protein